MNFIDYEQVFNNFSVPVSCCNTTNPLANETTCPDIVMDANVANITDLIYTEVNDSVKLFVPHLSPLILQGCAPQLVSYYHYILSVVLLEFVSLSGRYRYLCYI